MDPAVADERLATRNARLYLVGLAASLLGNSALSLVSGVWVKTLTGSSAQAGLVSACVYAPSLAGPVAGLLADRFDRRRWLIAVNLTSGATVLILLGVHSRSDVWLIFVAMAAYGVEEVLVDPAETALFATMLPPAIRQRVNGLRLGIQELGRLSAPLLGAALFTVIGGGAVAVLDAATFVVAAGTTAMLRVNARRPQREPDSQLLRELSEGARHIWADVPMRRIMIATTGVMAVSGLGVAAQYSLVTAIGERPAFLGVLTAALGAGSIAGALVSGRVIRKVGERRLALAGLANFAVGEVLQATGWLPAALLGRLVLGFALPWTYLAALNVTQSHTPDRLQGRVASAVTLVLFGPSAPMQALGSLAIAHATYSTIYIGSGMAAVAIAAWLALTGRKAVDPVVRR
jgi:MFS family permease